MSKTLIEHLYKAAFPNPWSSSEHADLILKTVSHIQQLETLLRDAVQHIETYDDGMAGWLGEAREVLSVTDWQQLNPQLYWFMDIQAELNEAQSELLRIEDSMYRAEQDYGTIQTSLNQIAESIRECHYLAVKNELLNALNALKEASKVQQKIAWDLDCEYFKMAEVIRQLKGQIESWQQLNPQLYWFMDKPKKATTLKHFTSKIYMITYEVGHGLGNREYGVVAVYNKQQQAEQRMKQLIKDKGFNWIEYDLKVIDMDNPSPTKLFYYAY